jgi:hypothetical protein
VIDQQRDEGTADARFGDLELTDAEIARRKAWMELGDEDVARLREMNALASTYADQVIDEFYDHLMAFDETAAFFRDPEVLERVKTDAAPLLPPAYRRELRS